MPLPSEYVMSDAVRSINEVIVYRANHPIHDTVNVYLPDDTLPPELDREVRRRLYQIGLQMRNIALLNIPLAVKALEVSQNPNEPYVVTEYTKHDLEEFVSNGVIIKPKRMFAILSQILEAVIDLAENGWSIGRIHPRQIKLSEQSSSRISFSVIEAPTQLIDQAGPAAAVESDEVSDTVEVQAGAQDDATLPVMDKPTQPTGKPQKPVKKIPVPQTKTDTERTATLGTDAISAQKRRTIQRNIHILGSVAYQLLFGRKYQAGDKAAETNIGKLAGKWRKILEKALTQSTKDSYEEYETMLQDVGKALNRNKRIAVSSIPFWLVLVVIGSYFAYSEYHQYRIMNSEAGQAIESFLEIVNKTNDEVPELKKPKPPDPVPDEQSILRPFEKITPVDED